MGWLARGSGWSAVRRQYAASELRSRLDVELAERFAEVVLDRARADERLSGDVSAGACTARQRTEGFAWSAFVREPSCPGRLGVRVARASRLQLGRAAVNR